MLISKINWTDATMAGIPEDYLADLDILDTDFAGDETIPLINHKSPFLKVESKDCLLEYRGNNKNEIVKFVYDQFSNVFVRILKQIAPAERVHILQQIAPGGPPEEPDKIRDKALARSATLYSGLMGIPTTPGEEPEKTPIRFVNSLLCTHVPSFAMDVVDGDVRAAPNRIGRGIHICNVMELLVEHFINIPIPNPSPTDDQQNNILLVWRAFIVLDTITEAPLLFFTDENLHLVLLALWRLSYLYVELRHPAILKDVTGQDMRTGTTAEFVRPCVRPSPKGGGHRQWIDVKGKEEAKLKHNYEFSVPHCPLQYYDIEEKMLLDIDVQEHETLRNNAIVLLSEGEYRLRRLPFAEPSTLTVANVEQDCPALQFAQTVLVHYLNHSKTWKDTYEKFLLKKTLTPSNAKYEIQRTGKSKPLQPEDWDKAGLLPLFKETTSKKVDINQLTHLPRKVDFNQLTHLPLTFLRLPRNPHYVFS